MQTFGEIFRLAYNVAWFFIIAHLVMSWLINFQVLNIRQPLVAQLWFGLNKLLEPIYKPIRRLLPNMGGIDLSPMVVVFGLIVVRIVLSNNLPGFARF